MNLYVFLSFITMLLYLQAGVYVLFKLPASKSKVLFIGLCLAFFLHAMFYFISPMLTQARQVYMLDRIASLGWVIFPVLTVKLFQEISQCRDLWVERIINFVLLPASLVFIAGYWADPYMVKLFYRHNNIWFYVVPAKNLFYLSFVAYLVFSVIIGLVILLKWRRMILSLRQRLQYKILLIALLLFFAGSSLTNLVLPAMNQRSSIPPLSYFTSLPLGFGLFFCLVQLRIKPFSPEIISRLISNHINEFIFFLDQNSRVYSANHYSLENLKYNLYELQRLHPEKLFNEYERIEAFIEQARDNPFSPEVRVDIITKNGDLIPVMLSVVKLQDRYQSLLGLVLIGVDYRGKIKLKDEVAERMRNEKILSNIREELEVMVEKRTHELFLANERLRQEIVERKRAEQQIKADLDVKIELVKEIHHRVKNNIQIIISLINMLGNHRTINQEAHETLRGIAERVRNISDIHEDFYASPNLSRINFSQFLKKSTEEIYRNSRIKRNVIFRLNVSDEYLSIDQAIPCGIIYYELLGNALRHAFPPGGVNPLAAFFTVNVEFFKREKEYTLIVSDNGVGVPGNIDLQHAKSTGFQLINVLVRQHLKGKIIAQNSYGTLFILKFSI